VTRPNISITHWRTGCPSPHLQTTRTPFPPLSLCPRLPILSHLLGSLPPLVFCVSRGPCTPTGVNDGSKLEVKGLYPPLMCVLFLSTSYRCLTNLQLDETDTRNKLYICFRRREIKAIRKTRASHVTFPDKLIHLQNELISTFEIANEVIARETLKKEAAQLQQEVRNQQITFSNLKRNFPTLSAKEDEELLVDKERIPKKPKVEL